jgi:hypothetical protein
MGDRCRQCLGSVYNADRFVVFGTADFVDCNFWNDCSDRSSDAQFRTIAINRFTEATSGFYWPQTLFWHMPCIILMRLRDTKESRLRGVPRPAWWLCLVGTRKCKPLNDPSPFPSPV